MTGLATDRKILIGALDRCDHLLTNMIIHLLTRRPVEARPAQSEAQNRNRG